MVRIGHGWWWLPVVLGSPGSNKKIPWMALQCPAPGERPRQLPADPCPSGLDRCGRQGISDPPPGGPGSQSLGADAIGSMDGTWKCLTYREMQMETIGNQYGNAWHIMKCRLDIYPFMIS